MPYDNFNSRSVFGEVQDQERAADQEAFMKQAALYGNMPTGNAVNVAPQTVAPTVQPTNVAQQAGLLNEVANRAGSMEAIAPSVSPVPTQASTPTMATQVVAQGNNIATRKPTAAEYEAGVINYLVNNRGYSYEDAQQLMAPRIHAYKVQEEAENKAMADNLINELSTIRIDDPAYRQKALQLLQLNPQMGGYMLKEGLSPREQYVYDRNRRDKREDQVFNANMQFDNWIKKLNVQDARVKQQLADRVQALVNSGVDPQNAMLAVFGGSRGGRGASSAGNTGVSSADYKRAVDGLKALDDEVAEGRLDNPNFQLSPQKQQQYNMLYAVKQRGDNEFFARNGVAMPQQQQQRVQINPNDYNSVGPFIQWAVEKNGGKLTPDLERAIRAKLGFNPDDNSPNNFVNQIFQTHYKK